MYTGWRPYDSLSVSLPLSSKVEGDGFDLRVHSNLLYGFYRFVSQAVNPSFSGTELKYFLGLKENNMLKPNHNIYPFTTIFQQLPCCIDYLILRCMSGQLRRFKGYIKSKSTPLVVKCNSSTIPGENL